MCYKIVITHYVVETRGQLKQGPTNTVVKMGHSVTLRCAGQSLQWHKSEPLAMITTGNIITRPAIYALTTFPPETYNLVIKNVTLSDAGGYRCSLTTDTTQAVWVQLIVFGGLICIRLHYYQLNILEVSQHQYLKIFHYVAILRSIVAYECFRGDVLDNLRGRPK